MGRNSSGQSTTEFLLLSPFLFLFFFLILQSFYCAYAALAVQRTAFSLARESSLTGLEAGAQFQARLYAAMAPLASLSHASRVSIAASRFKRELSPDGSRVRVLVRYPMPIWVPLAGRVLGEELPLAAWTSPALPETLSILRRAGIPMALPEGPAGSLPRFRWMSFEGEVHNEGYGGRNLHAKR